MSKSDSFFIRARVPTTTTNFNQVSIDLGAYVDALGKSVLRIHNLAVQYGDPQLQLSGGAPNADNATSFQITTQSQTALVDMTNKSLISSGTLMFAQDGSSAFVQITDRMDLSPQQWTNGYLVGVEQIYLGVDQTYDFVDAVSVVLECTVETLSQSAAMALALSQQ
jgi:hypothetical protein